MMFQEEELSGGSRLQKKKAARANGRRSFFCKGLLMAAFIVSLLIGYEWAAGRVGAPDLSTLVGELTGKNQVNVLLVGTDNRGTERARADTIALVNVNFQNRAVQILSIPRDTRVKIPGRGLEKINHAHAYGGIDLLQKTVEGLLGSPVDYYVETDFKGFTKIIDQLGGVSLDVEKRMYYPEEDINLKPGLQTLNGDKALAYVRYRSDGLGDIGRIKRQQKFFQAAFEQHLTLNTLAKAPQIIGQLNDYVKTDLPFSAMLRIANTLKDTDSDNLQTHLLPGRSQTINGLSYWIADADATQKLLASITKPKK
jgi:LCP family protein required for cell wall assembly